MSFDRGADNRQYSAARQIAGRTECLTLPRLFLDLQSTIFPLLTRIYLSDQYSGDDLLQLNTSRFPNLQKLRYSNNTIFPLNAPMVDPNFPVLHSLHLTMADGRVLCGIIDICRKTLENLYMSFHLRTQLPRDYTVTLPRLKRLVLLDVAGFCNKNVPTLVTPSLKYLYLHMNSGAERLPLQMDCGLLTHVRIIGDERIPLSAFRAAKVLQLSASATRFITFLEDLLNNPSVCPALETLEIDRRNERIDELVSTMNNPSGRRIQVSVFSGWWKQALPGSDFCEEGLPCEIERDWRF